MVLEGGSKKKSVQMQRLAKKNGMVRDMKKMDECWEVSNERSGKVQGLSYM